MRGFLASPQNNGISALNSQGSRIRGHIWPALINHANQAKGNGLLADDHAIWGCGLLQNQTNWIWQGNQGPNPRSHISNPLLIQEQPIQHDSRNGGVFGLFHIQSIGRQNQVTLTFQLAGHGFQSLIFLLSRSQIDGHLMGQK